MNISLYINEETALFTCWSFLIGHEEAVARTFLEYFHFMLLNTSAALHSKEDCWTSSATSEVESTQETYMCESKHIVLKY